MCALSKMANIVVNMIPKTKVNVPCYLFDYTKCCAKKQKITQIRAMKTK